MTLSEKYRITVALLLCTLIAGCDGDAKKLEAQNHQLTSLSTPGTIQLLKEIEQIRRHHAKLTLVKLDALKASVEAFLSNPNEKSIGQLKLGWKETHLAFIKSIFFSLTDQSRLRFQVDAWPIQAGFLDSIPGYPDSGIINDQTLRIDAETLQHQHGITATQEVSLGFHPLEFLIFSRNVADFELEVRSDAIAEDTGLETVPDTVPDSQSLPFRRRQMMAVIFNMMDKDIRARLEKTTRINAELIADVQNSDQPAHEGIKQVIERLLTSVQLLFAEVNYIGSQRSGHSTFSGTSWNDLRSQVAVLDEISGQKSLLAPVLIQLDKKLAQDYSTTLNQAVDILAQDEPETDKLPHILLLFAALGHQLEDMNKVLINDLR